MNTTVSVNPVFVKMKDIPDSDKRPSVLEMCLAAEKTAGQGSIIGAQEIRGLWRLYPASRKARTELLIKGMGIRNSTVQLSDTNPFVLRDDTGEEKPVTKVWVDNIPISLADSEVEHSMKKIGCEIRSDVKAERARDADGKLTRFLTGRRFLFITTPPTPLEKTLKISLFTAKIYHREQRFVTKTLACSKCLEQGHHASECSNDVVCRACKLSGHKRGDALCKFAATETGAQSRAASVEHRDRGAPTEGSEKAEQRPKEDSRGRVNTKQTTLRPSLELNHPRRHRSETPKRRRSKEAESPDSRPDGKQYRRSDDPQGSQPTDETSDTGVWG